MFANVLPVACVKCTMTSRRAGRRANIDLIQQLEYKRECFFTSVVVAIALMCCWLSLMEMDENTVVPRSFPDEHNSICTHITILHFHTAESITPDPT